jgi:hypothetical protein
VTTPLSPYNISSSFSTSHSSPLRSANALSSTMTSSMTPPTTTTHTVNQIMIADTIPGINMACTQLEETSHDRLSTHNHENINNNDNQSADNKIHPDNTSTETTETTDTISDASNILDRIRRSFSFRR